MGILVALVSGWGNVAGSPECAHCGSLHENMESLRSHLCQGCCRLFDRIQSAGRWFYRRLFAILLRWWLWLTVILLGWVAHDQNFLYIVLTFCQLPCSGRLNTPCGYGGYNIFFGIVITFICMYIYIHIFTHHVHVLLCGSDCLYPYACFLSFWQVRCRLCVDGLDSVVWKHCPVPLMMRPCLNRSGNTYAMSRITKHCWFFVSKLLLIHLFICCGISTWSSLTWAFADRVQPLD